ncbi:pentapeptide repeat-containing protein [Streptomyces sp. Da 82-17]|uniref:pentapeptide repeat-containing protein n=1 Tax=Streptomyces sp. Da 82-17 TaxID=3377116 RepID=UPI0038D4996D
MAGYTACLAHLSDVERDTYLTGLSPGADIDHRGTPFTEQLLRSLLGALLDPATRLPCLGASRFGFATFTGRADFGSATFRGGVDFESATFQDEALFKEANFLDGAWFGSAVFESTNGFSSATFHRQAWFAYATFRKDAQFPAASFGDAVFARAVFQESALFPFVTFKEEVAFYACTLQGDARFDASTFQGSVGFHGTTCEGDASFEGAVFEQPVTLGPLMCAGRVSLSRAMFSGPASVELAAHRLECWRTRWLSTAELRLRHATVDLSQSVLEHPLTIASEPALFTFFDEQPLTEELLANSLGNTVRLESLRGVDTAHLVLSDLDLSRCLFAGAVHLDQLRLEGNCTFASVPPGRRWRRGLPLWFTPRRTLAEEHHWRASRPGGVRGWNAAEGNSRIGPLQLAPIYRALRKSFEDGKHEPGAADFYYGEMEMRRHAEDIPRGERALLRAYWLLSGYGMRASRALVWLAAAMVVTITLLMAFGLPQESPKQQATGVVPPGGGRVTLEIDKDDPQNPTGDRFTGRRFERALNVTLNSVVFRSSGQDLTTAGTYIEMTSRLLEPALLAFAVLAVRGRVKR